MRSSLGRGSVAIGRRFQIFQLLRLEGLLPAIRKIATREQLPSESETDKEIFKFSVRPNHSTRIFRNDSVALASTACNSCSNLAANQR